MVRDEESEGSGDGIWEEMRGERGQGMVYGGDEGRGQGMVYGKR